MPKDDDFPMLSQVREVEAGERGLPATDVSAERAACALLAPPLARVRVLMDVLKERVGLEGQLGDLAETRNGWLFQVGVEMATASNVLAEDRPDCRERLVRLAAVAVAAIECLDRQEKEVPR